ncbi:MAG: hypothetical protein ACI4PQ_00535 [Butyricicoccaceae bacterium]
MDQKPETRNEYELILGASQPNEQPEQEPAAASVAAPVISEPEIWEEIPPMPIEPQAAELPEQTEELPVEPQISQISQPEPAAPEPVEPEAVPEPTAEPAGAEPENEPEAPEENGPLPEASEDAAVETPPAPPAPEIDENGNQVFYIPVAPDIREKILNSGRRQPEPEPPYAASEPAEEQPVEETFYYEEEEAPEPPRPAPRRQQKKARKRVRPPEETPDDTENFREAATGWELAARRTRMRSFLVLALTLVSAYLSCAQYLSLPCPLQYTQHARVLLGVLLALAVAAAVCAMDIVRSGLRDLYWKQPGFDSLTVIVLLVTLLHAVIRLIRPGEELPYLCAAMLILFASMRSKIALARGKRSTCKAAAASRHPDAVHEWSQESTLIKEQASGFDSFWAQLKKRNALPHTEYRITPIILIAAPVLAVLTCLLAQDISRLPYTLSAILIGACPLCTMLTFAKLFQNTTHQMQKNGVSTAGCAAIERICQSDDVVMTDADLFPNGTVRLEHIELCGQLDERRVLSYAAALAGENVLGRMLYTEAYQRFSITSRARELQYYEGGGRGASLGGSNVLFGPAEFMRRMGVILPGSISENELFLSVDHHLMAVFTIRYLPSKKILQALHTVIARGGGICLDTNDCWLTSQHVERVFGLPKDTVRMAKIGELPDNRELPDCPIVALLTRAGAAPYLSAVELSEAYCRLNRTALRLAAFASTLGMLLMAYLCFLFAPASATPLRVLGYQVLWYLPALLILHEIKKR